MVATVSSPRGCEHRPCPPARVHLLINRAAAVRLCRWHAEPSVFCGPQAVAVEERLEVRARVARLHGEAEFLRAHAQNKS